MIRAKAVEGYNPYSLFLFFSILYLIALNFISFPVTTLLKPLPIVCLMTVVISSRCSSLIKKGLLLALFFSILGDMALTLPIARQLEAGLGFFLMAHLTYIFVFVSGLKRSFATGGVFKALRRVLKAFSTLALVIVSATVFFVLYPHLGNMTLGVLIYSLVINLMAACALQLNRLLGLGAIFFLLSDSLLAFNQFVYKDADYSLWIMVTYYLAQGFLILGSIRFFSKRN